MVCIIVALKSECKKLLELFENKKQLQLADKEAYVGNLNGHECIIAISGIGKVSAGLTAQLLIDKFDANFILNFGTCGGMNDSVKILNYYAIKKCCQFDFDLREIDGVPLGYIQDYDRVFFDTQTNGLEFLEQSQVASADRFTNSIADINAINEMGCSLRDMECGAIAQVCTSNNIPLYVIKGVTDVYGNKTAQEQYFENLNKVGEGFPKIIIKAIDSICKTIGIK